MLGGPAMTSALASGQYRAHGGQLSCERCRVLSNFMPPFHTLSPDKTIFLEPSQDRNSSSLDHSATGEVKALIDLKADVTCPLLY